MGIAGAILAVPTAAILQVLINEWLAADEQRTPQIQTPPGTAVE
jgi:predicted PurR-regulated permease PerM